MATTRGGGPAASENQAHRDELEVRDSPTRLGRSCDSTDREVKHLQKQVEADVEQAVTPELADWLAKRNLLDRGQVIAVSLQESGCPSEEWVAMLTELEGDGETMFKIFMQAVEKKYQADPGKFGGALPDTPRTATSKKIAAAVAAGAVVVTVAAGGAGFVCNSDMTAVKVSPGGASAAAGATVGMELTGFTGGGRRQAMGGVSWAAFKGMCRQSPYPRVFTFTPVGEAATVKQISEGIPRQQHSSVSQTPAEQADARRREVAVADVTVAFDAPGSLGLALIEDAGGRVLVKEIIPGTPAAAMPQLRVGMVLRTLQPAGQNNRQEVDGMTYRSILRVLKSEPRPLQLGFVDGSRSQQTTRSASPGRPGGSHQLSPQKQAMITVGKERKTTAKKLHQYLKTCPDVECREIVNRLKAVQAEISGAIAAELEEQDMKRAFADAQAQTRLQEQAEAAATAEAEAQMRAREHAKAKADLAADEKAAEEAAAEAAVKAEAEWAEAEAEWAAGEEAAAEEAAREEREVLALALEAQNAEEAREEREARLKPRGTVNVYISPMIDQTEARREALAVRRLLRDEGVSKGTLRTVSRAEVERTDPNSPARGTPIAEIIENVRSGGSSTEPSSDRHEFFLDNSRRSDGGVGSPREDVVARKWAIIAARRGWGAVPLFPPGQRLSTDWSSPGAGASSPVSSWPPPALGGGLPRG